MPQFSIITINYNNWEGLQKTIQTVFDQTFTDYEYIIIDGGSTDTSKSIIVQNTDKISHWISESDKGMYDAMNKGIQMASGKYFMFLNSGDWLVHENILFDVSKSIQNNEADIYYANIQLENDKGNSLHTYPSELTLDFWESSTINHQSSLLKASLFKKYGLYDTTYSIAADYAFFLKSYIHGSQFEYINKELVHYKLDGISEINKNEYRLQMKAAWLNIVPRYIDVLYQDRKAHTLLMNYRIMKIAKYINDRFKIFKKYL